MSTAFKVFGPFEIENKQRVHDKEFQKSFWCDCVHADEDNYQLSFEKGIYLFSLRNATNFNPQYVGMTSRDLRTEVFSDRNALAIITKENDGVLRGVRCLHLLASQRKHYEDFRSTSMT